MISLKEIYNEVLTAKSGNLYVQVFRSIVVGFIAFVFDTATLFVFTEYVGLHYLQSTVLGFMVGLTVSYILSIKWVFNVRKVKNVKIEILIFGIISAVGFGLTYLFMWLFTDVLSLHYLLSKIITTLLVFVWNFTAKKLTLFINDGK